MALITCPECKNEISDTAKTCPKCGFKMPSNPYGIMFHIFAVLDFGLLFFLILAFATVPVFGEKFASFGVNLPWLTKIFFRIGYILEPFNLILKILLVGIAGLFFFYPGFKQKLESKQLIIVFVVLLALHILFRISINLPLGTIGELMK
jgi:hypothetical protein